MLVIKGIIKHVVDFLKNKLSTGFKKKTTNACTQMWEGKLSGLSIHTVNKQFVTGHIYTRDARLITSKINVHDF